MTVDRVRRVLLDTNVLLDHLLQRDERADTVKRFMECCVRRDVTMLCTATSLKDIAYISVAMIKRQCKPGESELEKATLRMLIDSVPWRCIEQSRELCEVVTVDQQTCDDAMTYRVRHNVFEDDLIIAAARQAHADYVVTSDAEMIEHFPEYCRSPQHMTTQLKD